MNLRIAFIGFGEAGQAVAKGLSGDLSAYDIDPSKLDGASIGTAQTIENALLNADAVFSLITANQTVEAARAAAGHLPKGAFWFDGNSCAPSTKLEASRIIAAAGGRYVDTAIMAPIHPKLHQTPMLLSGPHAAESFEVTKRLEMNCQIVGDNIGDASTIKMLRSVIIKGIEAVTVESMLAARRAGVEDAVIASLDASNPEVDWAKAATYRFERMMTHGTRRAEEMGEVAKTLRDLGLPDLTATATRALQAKVGELALDAGKADLGARADAILKRL